MAFSGPSWLSSTSCSRPSGPGLAAVSHGQSQKPENVNGLSFNQTNNREAATITTTTTTTTTKQTTTNNKQQTTNNKQQTTNNKQQTTNNKQPTTNNQQPTTNNQQPTTNNQQPTTNNQQPTTNNQQPTTNNQQPTTNNQQPTNNKQQVVRSWLVVPNLPFYTIAIDLVPKLAQLAEVDTGLLGALEVTHRFTLSWWMVTGHFLECFWETSCDDPKHDFWCISGLGLHGSRSGPDQLTLCINSSAKVGYGDPYILVNICIIYRYTYMYIQHVYIYICVYIYVINIYIYVS